MPDLACEVLRALVEAAAEDAGLAGHGRIVNALDPGGAGPVSQITFRTDSPVRQLYLLVAEGLQALQNANLVCLIILSDWHYYALTRLGEDAVARGAVLEILTSP